MLGKKITYGLVDNRLGKKLTTPINSLGSKLIKGGTQHHYHGHQEEPKEIKSYLEKR